MAYDKEIAAHLRASINQSGWHPVEEMEKNDGLSFTLRNEPLTRVEGDKVIMRCFPDDTETYLNNPGIRRYVMPDNNYMPGWLIMDAEISHSKEHLDKWLQVSYNYVSTIV